MDKETSQSLHTLVIDDDSFMLDLVGATLNCIGVANVSTASTGTDALELLDNISNDVDLLICDLNMPNMDGIEFLRHLAERKFPGDVALISGEDSRLLKTAGTLAGEHDLNILGTFEKPVSKETLAGIICRVGERAPQRQHSVQDPIAEEELRKGILSDEFIVFFQPKVTVADRALSSVETLVRWQHPERGFLGPNAFIPLAEKCGLIDDLTDVVFAKAMRQGGQWRAEGLEIKIAVNISVGSFKRLDLPELITNSAREAGMEAENVIVEVTESRLMKDSRASLETLTRLSLKGVVLSIDDFGTGYSSMEQLQRIPFSELKIDRAFVHGAADDPASCAILESSAELAKKLNMSIVAEGVEDQNDWDLVASLGIDLVQGYFIAKPMPGPEIIPWYAAHKANLE